MSDAASRILGPRQPLEGKYNFKRNYLIDLDGGTTETVRLHIPDMRMREEVICLHYLRMLATRILKETIGINIISRDAPWDFGIELSTGAAFGIEITAIADNERQFVINSQQEWRDVLARMPKIKLRHLEKMSRLLPDPDLSNAVAKATGAGMKMDDEVENPDYLDTPPNGPTRIIVSRSEPVIQPLANRLAAAMSSKAAKAADKDGLVLIIDNRTSLASLDEFFEAAEALTTEIEASPFAQIWIYTGYSSDFDGNNSEYTFVPIKIDEQVADLLASK